MVLTYYMFVNHGWRPRQVERLTEREKALMLQMAVKEAKARERAVNRAKGGK